MAFDERTADVDGLPFKSSPMFAEAVPARPAAPGNRLFIHDADPPDDAGACCIPETDVAINYIRLWIGLDPDIACNITGV